MSQLVNSLSGKFIVYGQYSDYNQLVSLYV